MKLSFPRAYKFWELPTFKHWEVSQEKHLIFFFYVLLKCWKVWLHQASIGTSLGTIRQQVLAARSAPPPRQPSLDLLPGSAYFGDSMF